MLITRKEYIFLCGDWASFTCNEGILNIYISPFIGPYEDSSCAFTGLLEHRGILIQTMYYSLPLK